MKTKDRIIVALDVGRVIEANILVEQLAEHVGGFKVGLKFITAGEAVALIRLIHDLNPYCNVFYDGKFNDIPNTVGDAAWAASNLLVWAFSIHASSGVKAMKAAVDHRGEALALAVTVLTSLDDTDNCGVRHIFNTSRGEKVLAFAYDAEQAGCDGVVCSPRELGPLNKYANLRSLLKVVPGIRPLWAAINDQVCFATPAAAVLNGADYLVIGRPITQPPANIGTPRDAVQRIIEEIDQA